jgi:hypothetical protein
VYLINQKKKEGEKGKENIRLILTVQWFPGMEFPDLAISFE